MDENTRHIVASNLTLAFCQSLSSSADDQQRRHSLKRRLREEESIPAVLEAYETFYTELLKSHPPRGTKTAKL